MFQRLQRPAHTNSPAKHARGRHRGVLVAAIAGAFALFGVLAVSEPASAATQRCTSKPAVCARLAAKPVSKAYVAPATQRSKCTAKPSVCALNPKLADGNAQQAYTSEPARVCTSKPAVCARLAAAR
jgi:hypothetical protein